MGTFLAAKHQLMNKRSTNKKDAYTRHARITSSGYTFVHSELPGLSGFGIKMSM